MTLQTADDSASAPSARRCKKGSFPFITTLGGYTNRTRQSHSSTGTYNTVYPRTLNIVVKAAELCDVWHTERGDWGGRAQVSRCTLPYSGLPARVCSVGTHKYLPTRRSRNSRHVQCAKRNKPSWLAGTTKNAMTTKPDSPCTRSRYSCEQTGSTGGYSSAPPATSNDGP